MALDLMLNDLKPEKRPETIVFIGCPTTKYRHPFYVSYSGSFSSLPELRELHEDDLESLSLDVSDTLESITPVKKADIGNISLERPSKERGTPVPFDSRRYHHFLRIYTGEAEFNGCLINQYEIAAASGRFMIVVYLTRDGEKFLLLRTNDSPYVKSHDSIDWGNNASQLFQQIMEPES